MLENKPYIEVCVKQNTKAVSQLGIFHFLILPPDCPLFEIFLEEPSFLKGGWPWGKWHLNWALKHETEKWGRVFRTDQKRVCRDAKVQACFWIWKPASGLVSFPGDSTVENSPARQETQVPTVGGRDALEEEMTTHFSILAWEIPWTEDPGGLQSLRLQKESDIA